MNYKKIFKSRSLRIKILKMLNWIPDKFMIKLQYRIHTGRVLNLKHPLRYTEKIQLYKLKYRNDIMLRCTDKFEVRSVMEELGYKHILVPLIEVYDTLDQVNFDSLPNQFVAKTSDGGGGNQVLICRNKKDLSSTLFLSKIEEWLSAKKSKSAGREWAYENGFPRKIIIEKLLKEESKKDITDYKFWCFNGKPYYCQVIGSRSEKETIDFFDMEWKHQPFRGLNKICENAKDIPIRPDKFDEMKSIAGKLSEGFPFVRVDLYQAEGKVYFGELTFYPASGYGQFTPDEWDVKLGSLFNI